MEEKTNESHLPKKITSDLFWSFGAVVLLNATIQIVIYPTLQRHLGVSGYGEMLYHLSLITVLGSGVGMATSNYRLLKQNDTDIANGDYLVCLLSMMFVGVIPIIALTYNSFKPLQLVLFVILAFFIGLRCYSDVAFRITLNYKRYFIFYLTLSVGYIIGIALFPLFKMWTIVLLIGEVLCVVFCVISGNIYYPLNTRASFWVTEKQILILAMSYLLYNGVIQLDRIMLRNILGSEAVSVYYVSSLLGKILALVVGPLNAVLLSYLSKMKKRLNYNAVLLIAVAVVAISGICFIVVSIVAPWITKLLYPDIDCGRLLLWANLGQILCFAGSLVLTVLLTIAPSYWQFLSQGIYALVFVIFGWVGARNSGLYGFIIGTLFANIVRFVLSIIALLFSVKKYSNSSENDEDLNKKEGIM